VFFDFFGIIRSATPDATDEQIQSLYGAVSTTAQTDLCPAGS
jgi:hypothetical protein